MLRVADQLLKTLKAANEHGDEDRRDEMLQELKDEVCFPIEDKVMKSGVLESEVTASSRYYYEGISWFLAEEQGETFAQELLPMFTSMWDNADVRCTFALTMYRYIFKRAEAGQGEQLKHFIVLLKGANSLFWQDLMCLQSRFQSLFAFLVHRLTDPDKCIVDVDIYNDLLKLLSRFIGYYSLSPDSKRKENLQDLSVFLEAIHRSRWYCECVSEESGTWIKGDMEGLAMSPAAVVVVELVHQLHYICSEEVLTTMLLRMKTLRTDVVSGLDWHTRTKLQAVLHGLSSPGGPLYPPRPIRVRTRQLLDMLFPRGRLGRRVVNLSFRLLHPYRWPLSLAHCTRTSNRKKKSTQPDAESNRVLVQTPMNLWQLSLEVLPVSISSRLSGGAAYAKWALRSVLSLPGALFSRSSRGPPVRERVSVVC